MEDEVHLSCKCSELQTAGVVIKGCLHIILSGAELTLIFSGIATIQLSRVSHIRGIFLSLNDWYLLNSQTLQLLYNYLLHNAV